MSEQPPLNQTQLLPENAPAQQGQNTVVEAMRPSLVEFKEGDSHLSRATLVRLPMVDQGKVSYPQYPDVLAIPYAHKMGEATRWGVALVSTHGEHRARFHPNGFVFGREEAKIIEQKKETNTAQPMEVYSEYVLDPGTGEPIIDPVTNEPQIETGRREVGKPVSLGGLLAFGDSPEDRKLSKIIGRPVDMGMSGIQCTVRAQEQDGQVQVQVEDIGINKHLEEPLPEFKGDMTLGAVHPGEWTKIHFDKGPNGQDRQVLMQMYNENTARDLQGYKIIPIINDSGILEGIRVDHVRANSGLISGQTVRAEDMQLPTDKSFFALPVDQTKGDVYDPPRILLMGGAAYVYSPKTNLGTFMLAWEPNSSKVNTQMTLIMPRP